LAALAVYRSDKPKGCPGEGKLQMWLFLVSYGFLLLQFNSSITPETGEIEKFCQGECPAIFREFFTRCPDADTDGEATTGLDESKHCL
jgi:hypothetical protein